MSDPHQSLSRRERQVMDIVWAHGKVTAVQVQKNMPDELAGSSVRTFLRSLESKGFVSHEMDGAEYVYAPTRPRASAGKSALQRVLATFFDGSVDKALAAYLADARHARKIDPNEYKRLVQYIEQARTETDQDGKGTGK